MKCTPLLFTFSKPQSRLFNTSQWMDAITSQNKAETIEFETGSLRSVYLQNIYNMLLIWKVFTKGISMLNTIEK